MGQDATGISNTPYAKRRGELMSLISSLRSIGAQADLDLPRIVCIGNQSAGKSSLIEAISRIRVPRDSGTCTRCPMECRLSPADSTWTAKISLRIEFDSAGKRLPETKSYRFGSTLIDPRAVELGLRQAQSAILNWGTRSYDEFLNMSEVALMQGSNLNRLKFSKNVVCIDISGPKLTDLVFIDLPGLIQNAEEDMIKLVEKMVVEQIEGNSIILVTLPMSDDLENQKAALLAKKQDPQGFRTIGVLTKPDMLTAGATRSREAWLDVVEGRKHSLTHGYYCTRQPEDSDRARGISFDAARTAETEFFKNTSPWSTSLQSERFGTRNLIEKLSTLLSQKIDESLPNLQSELKKALDRTNTELATLPPPLLRDPSSELMALVTKFSTAFSANVEGTRGSERLIQNNRKAYVAFKITIRRSAPDFRPFVAASDPLATGRDADMDASEVVGDEPLPAQYSLTTSPMYLQDVRAHINRARTRELPNNVPFPAKVALIERFTSTWESPISECFRDIHAQVSETLMQLIAHHFRRFGYLQNQVRAIIADEIDKYMRETQAMLATILRFERYPFTQNDHYYQTCREKFLAHYRAVRSGLVQDSQGWAKRQRIEANEPATSMPSSATQTSAASAGSAPANTSSSKKINTPRAPSEQPQAPQYSASGSPPQPTVSGQTTQSTVNPFEQALESNTQISEGTDKPNKSPLTGSSFAKDAPRFTNGAPEAQSGLNNGSTNSKERADTPKSFSFSFSPNSVQQMLQPGAPSVAFGIPGPTVRGAGKPAVSASFNSPELQNDALAALAKLGLHVSVSDLQKLVPSDPWEDEMTVAAEVRSYYETSYKRIIDNVPMTIDNIFLRSLAEKMQSSLIAGLGLGDKERAAAYLAEDRSVVSKREELLTRQKRLENVRQELLKFGY